MTKRILHVVTNVAHYADPTQPTGLWLSELTHAYEIFAARGYQQRLVSPRGGESPLEPRALGSVSYTHLRAHETLMNLVCR
ncbi:type 1 glutamine amidotransferase domain-containing protein, partial [Pseudomonas aeruginosa]|nr:type 1 glutamine amidotransferase domain-containing protein [Pseudomonas aeruginosa]